MKCSTCTKGNIRKQEMLICGHIVHVKCKKGKCLTCPEKKLYKEECCICLDYHETSDWVYLTCMHNMGATCCYKYFQTLDEHQDWTCPICRTGTLKF
jgi:hypothetical protein